VSGEDELKLRFFWDEKIPEDEASSFLGNVGTYKVVQI
jgi:hypothetical protein